jgi:riboflavin transporter FmnP
MKVQLIKNSLRPRARMIGIVFLLYFLAAILAQFLTSRNHVGYGNGANFIATGLYCLVTVLFYYLFKPVSRMLSLIAAFFSLVGCIVMTLELFRPSSLATNPLLFFGPYCLLIGYLIFKSTFLPHILGILMAIAGAGWLIFLVPNLPGYLSLSLEGLGICAEASLMLWLIAKGINEERWKQQSGAA